MDTVTGDCLAGTLSSLPVLCLLYLTHSVDSIFRGAPTESSKSSCWGFFKLNNALGILYSQENAWPKREMLQFPQCRTLHRTVGCLKSLNKEPLYFLHYRSWNNRKIGSNLFGVLWGFILPHVPYANIDQFRFMSSTAASHQGAILMSWLHFLGALMSNIFTFTVVNDLWVKCIIFISFPDMQCPPHHMTDLSNTLTVSSQSACSHHKVLQ